MTAIPLSLNTPDVYSGPPARTRNHRPYFTPSEVAYLSEKQRGKLTESQEDRARQQAMSFIEAVGSQMGYPRKTIATAQTFYYRFHLFFPLKDFNYYDVTMACMYVSTKLHDTLKKPRDILMTSYAVRFPELAAKVKVVGGEVEMDHNVVENDRRRMIAIERLILEMICFNFGTRMSFSYVIKIGRALGCSKDLTKLAWHLAVDSHRTLIPLQYPPHTIALACVYLAALLASFETQATPMMDTDRSLTSHEICAVLSDHGLWEKQFNAQVEDLEDIVHSMLDLLTSFATNAPSSLTTSPRTPSSPSAYHLSTVSSSSQVSPNAPSSLTQVLSSTASLTRLKIALREREHEPRERAPLSMTDPTADVNPSDGDEVEGIGKNEGTVRFLFGPAAM
ncbi:hypothetical protein FRB96_003023 [Tulasnella sp. 330]|nr:hypothetical protein FRB96_003023 [Tulasnella sp. 330]KAG8876344.1 hypothetical protein FRB97_004283 [Tulasnella sp. 331]KAG8878573.1 hypothetical protein FRB98_006086 [Tulasnella sp. 332]